MTRIHKEKIISGAAALLMLLAGCTKDINEREINIGSGLGFPVKVLTLESGAGQVDVPVIATREFDIRTDASWLTVPSVGQEGREGFTLNYKANTSLPRAAEVVVAIDATSHYDTLTVRQKGQVVPQLEASSPVLSFPGSASGKRSINLQTNIPDDVLSVSWDCEGNEVWLSDVAVKGSVLEFSYGANPLSMVRHASITVSYTDAFGDVITIPFQLSQMSSDDSAGTAYDFPALFALATEEGTLLEDDIVIEGIVVSDKENGNCGDNAQLSVTSIDYSCCLRTIYLEALDGSVGIRLITKTEDDNVFLQGDRVKLSLRGATLWKSKVINPDADPVYYELSGVKGNMAIECEHLGRTGIPVKEKYIGALTDEDIFTYVTIKDCELPIRKGPLTPVNEQFTNATETHKVSKFGVLLHDICGGSMYLYTNTTCPYRRDGSVLPQGSGKVSGVVVHELYSRFSYQDNSSADPDTWGNIGRYQLRHTTKEDFDLAATMQENSFSGIICEWRYIKDKNLECYYATDGDPNAYFSYSFVYPDSYTDGRAGKLPINKMTDYSYLGPVGPENTGNANGLGVITADGSDWMSQYWTGYNSEYASNINAKGNGEVPSEAGSAWSTNLTVRDGGPMYTVLVFSTAGKTSSRMSMQISSMNYFYSSTQKINGVPLYLEGPRYWWVEYSLDGTAWTPVAKYSLPEYCQTSPMTQLWQTAGYKPVNIPLPADKLLGKDKVWIRIIPDAAMQTGSKTAYLDPSIIYPASGSFPTAWNYIGIRYNTVDPPATDFGDGNGSGIDPMEPIDYIW